MKPNLIFGSCAMKHWFPDCRIPNDLEYITEEKYWIPAFQYILDNNKHDLYVDKDLLYTIKVSHAAWDIHWDKTMYDIVFLKNKGCQFDKTFYDLLYQDWTKLHRAKKVNLNVKNEDFFTNRVTRMIEHDELHKILAFYEEPLHTRIRKDLNSPLCNEKLFDLLSEDDKIRCALEEIMVIGTERFMFNGTKSYVAAKHKALKLLITSMTTGWFNRFLILNFEPLIKSENEEWKRKLQESGLTV